MKEVLQSKRWILVSGKGGTGKTILASSIAVQLAKMDEKTLVVSLDPAHSLSDALKIDVGSEIRNVKEVPNLHALEFTPKEMYELDKEKLESALNAHQEEGDEIGELGEMGGMNMLPFSPREMIDTVKDLSSMPLEYAEGLNFIKLFRSLQDSNFDKIVFDTAPTGHTLKLLELPDTLDSFLGKIIKFRLKLKSFWNNFKGLFGFGQENPQKKMLELLEKLKETVKDLKKVLKDEEKTEFFVITLPVIMSILESLRLVGDLEGYDIPHHFLAVNKFRIYNGECDFCKSLSDQHAKNLQTIKEKFSNLELRIIPYFSKEVRGIDSLEKFYEYFSDSKIDKVEEWIEEGRTLS